MAAHDESLDSPPLLCGKLHRETGLSTMRAQFALRSIACSALVEWWGHAHHAVI